MKNRIVAYILLLVCISLQYESNAQGDPALNQVPFDLHVIVPQGVDDSALQQKGRTDAFDLFVYKVETDRIDLTHFKSMYPKAELPSFLLVEAPWEYVHNTNEVLLGIINKEGDLQDLVLIYVGNRDQRTTYFYLDKTLDGKFDKWSMIPIDFKSPTLKVKLKSAKTKNPIEIQLRNNFKEKVEKRIKRDIGKVKTNIIDALSIGINASFGSGKMDYSFMNLESGYPYWYDLDYAVVKFGTSINYDLRLFRITGGLDFQKFNYYTSYTNRQYGEPIQRRTNQGLQIIEQVETDRNLDEQPSTMLNYYLGLGFKIPISDYSNIQPAIQYGLTKYLPSEFYPDRRDREAFYSLNGTSYLDLGFRAEFTVGDHKAIFFGLSYRKINWAPRGFVESLPQEDFSSNFNMIKGDFGYRFGL